MSVVDKESDVIIELDELDLLSKEFALSMGEFSWIPGFCDQKQKIELLRILYLTISENDQSFVEAKLLIPEIRKGLKMISSGELLNDLKASMKDASWVLSCEALAEDMGECLWRLEQDISELRRRERAGDYITESGALEPSFRELVIQTERSLSDVAWRNWEKKK